MSDHYFTNRPQTASETSAWTYTLRGKEFKFVTDTGVFSKKTVDFGSRLLIETLDFSEMVPGNLLDIGCGYGPIGLSLAKEDAERKVEMVDVNERALGLAKQNASNNRLANVLIHTSDIYESVEGKDFAAIVSNPPIRAGKQVVHGVLTGAYDLLKHGGTLTVVIQKKQGAPSAKAKMEETFRNAEVIAKDKGYWIIQSVKQED
ncbi:MULTISPECIES: class I SAM-dependent methyltransferase [Carnobacterium]|uniref:16S RNA G1207 methylase RsmC n=2 Tax=Carnobacterium inhibens TaxID=147709 RepID=U5SFQ3_9LACT|nr:MULTISPECIES: class I SAM-dependent methyltransferase [Carnobacterium]AGY82687.1 16S RNA G1207 methylase RsmC [Carnobacterium inhibens subsp. gilichinskyi]MBC9826270.1 methyltransferase [Carnobacterium inhibens]MCM3512311.1 class I SAM-dependent methyltransferase [Carnobacterium inhibens]MDN5371797.1 rRNA (guanine1207-N2)-methyltransferase [Carnobacterium sp.]